MFFFSFQASYYSAAFFRDQFVKSNHKKCYEKIFKGLFPVFTYPAKLNNTAKYSPKNVLRMCVILGFNRFPL